MTRSFWVHNTRWQAFKAIPKVRVADTSRQDSSFPICICQSLKCLLESYVVRKRGSSNTVRMISDFFQRSAALDEKRVRLSFYTFHMDRCMCMHAWAHSSNIAERERERERESKCTSNCITPQTRCWKSQTVAEFESDFFLRKSTFKMGLKLQ